MSNNETDKYITRFIADEYEQLKRYALSLIRDQDRAEDCTSLALVRLWEYRDHVLMGAHKAQEKNLDHSSPEVYLRRWLRIVVRNLIRDEARMHWRKDIPLDEVAEASLAPHATCVDNESLAYWYRFFLEELIKKGDKESLFQAVCARLLRIEGYTYEEAVAQLESRFPYFLKGYSPKLAARRSRVEAAVKHADKEFIQWLGEESSRD